LKFITAQLGLLLEMLTQLIICLLQAAVVVAIVMQVAAVRVVF
jgi:hypothetical protein